MRTTKSPIWLLAFAILLAAVQDPLAALPRPKAESDCLVVGSFILDFPDSFFQRGPKTFDSGVILEFLNESSGKKFQLRTDKGGYYSFVSDGSSSYKVLSAGYSVTMGRAKYEGKAPLTLGFQAKPHTLACLDNIKISYRPAEDLIEAGGDESRTFRYTLKVETSDGSEDSLAYLRKKDPKSAWLGGYPVYRPFETPKAE